ncbi:MAG: hypothetical protein WAX67_10525 [Rugosibacter sp.]
MKRSTVALIAVSLRSLGFTASALLASSAFAQDAVRTDGDKYKIILENGCVRVLDYHDNPGEKTHQHKHPAFVLYALSPFKRTLTLPDGKVIKREFKEGDVMWSEEQTHIGENIGQTPTHVVIVELKKLSGSCSAERTTTGNPMSADHANH